jgi:hypothetical protein
VELQQIKFPQRYIQNEGIEALAGDTPGGIDGDDDSGAGGVGVLQDGEGGFYGRFPPSFLPQLLQLSQQIGMQFVSYVVDSAVENQQIIHRQQK